MYLAIFLTFFSFTLLLLVLLLPPERMAVEIVFDANHYTMKWLTQSSYCNFPILFVILLFLM